MVMGPRPVDQMDHGSAADPGDHRGQRGDRDDGSVATEEHQQRTPDRP